MVNDNIYYKKLRKMLKSNGILPSANLNERKD